MAGTFSQQIASQSQQVAQTPTRTQRLQQEIRANEEKKRYETLKAEAQRLQKEVFIDKVETVTERYRSGGRWRTRTVQKVTDPFTEQEYAQEYSKLSPELKQFFASPQDIQVAKQQKIDNAKQQANATIQNWQSYIDDKKADIERMRQKIRERHYTGEQRQNYEDAIDERQADIEEYQDKINTLQREFGKIDLGYDWQDLKSYAEDRARNQRDRSEQQAMLREQIRNDPTLIPIYNTENPNDVNKKIVGTIDSKKTQLPDYLKNQQVLTNKDVDYYKSISNWSSKAGYNALPSWAKEKVLNPKAYEWQQQNQGEVLIFNEKGEAVKIQSSKYGQTLELKDYNAKPVTDFEKANPDEKLLKKDDGTVYGVQSKQFGGTFTIDEYNKKVDEYNKNVKTPEQMVEEWKAQDKEKPIYIDFTTIDTSKQGYNTRGTMGGNTTQLIPITSDDQIIQEDGKVMKTIKKGIDWVMNKSGDISVPLFILPTTNPTKMPEIKVRDVTDPLKEANSKKIEEIYMKDLEQSGIKAELDAKYQQEYQTRFERKYMEDIILGKIDFETAQKEFENSSDAKIINKKYGIDVEKKRAERGITWASAKIFGLQTLGAGLKLVPETYGELAVEGAIVYTGYSALKYIPASVLNVATAGFGVKGTIDALNPTIAPEKRIGGIVTATLSFGTLGYQAYKWARTPTIKTENIIVKKTITNPKLERGFLTKQGSRQVTDLAGKTTLEEFYKGNKLSEQILYGRRTIVSTKWRDLLGMKPVYQGIPYRQLGKTYELTSFRGDYIFKTQSARQKAFDLLVKRGGLTKAQATQTLRYYQPRIVLSNYQADILVRSGDYLKNPVINIKGIRDVENAKIIINKELGISTRGGQKVREYITGKGQIVGEFKGNTLYRTTYDIEKRFLTSKGFEFQKLNQAGKTTKTFEQLTVSSEKGQDVFNIPVQKGIYKQYPYDVFSEQNLYKQILPKGKYGFSETQSGVFKRTNLPSVEYDLRKMYGFSVKEDIIRKTKPSDLTKLNDPKYLKEIIKSFKDVYGAKNVDKTILGKAGKTSGGAGTISPETIQQTTKLQSTLSPVKNIKQQIKQIYDIITKSSSVSALGFGLASASTQTVKTRQREDLKYNLANKYSDAQYNRLLDKLDVQQSPRQTPQEKLSSGQSQILTPITVPETIRPSILNPPFTPPTPRPRIKPFVMPSDKDLLKQKIKEKRVKEKNYFALLPDFTARALGLKPQELSLKDSLKAIRKVQTGFEIRTGVRVKRPMSDKELMRGIMK